MFLYTVPIFPALFWKHPSFPGPYIIQSLIFHLPCVPLDIHLGFYVSVVLLYIPMTHFYQDPMFPMTLFCQVFFLLSEACVTDILYSQVPLFYRCCLLLPIILGSHIPILPGTYFDNKVYSQGLHCPESKGLYFPIFPLSYVPWVAYSYGSMFP